MEIYDIKSIDLSYLKESNHSKSAIEQEALKIENLDGKPGVSLNDIQANRLLTKPGFTNNSLWGQGELTGYKLALLKSHLSSQLNLYNPVEGFIFDVIQKENLQTPLKVVSHLISELKNLSTQNHFLQLNSESQKSTMRLYAASVNAIHVNQNLLSKSGKEIHPEFHQDFSLILASIQNGTCFVNFTKENIANQNNIQGMAQPSQLRPGSYEIIINNDQIASTQLLHEAGHIADFKQGRIQSPAKREHRYFQDSVYDQYLGLTHESKTPKVSEERIKLKNKILTLGKRINEESLNSQEKALLKLEFSKAYLLFSFGIGRPQDYHKHSEQYARDYLSGKDTSQSESNFYEAYTKQMSYLYVQKSLLPVYSAYKTELEKRFISRQDQKKIESAIQSGVESYRQKYLQTNSIEDLGAYLMANLVGVALNSNTNQIMDHIDQEMLPTIYKQINYD